MPHFEVTIITKQTYIVIAPNIGDAAVGAIDHANGIVSKMSMDDPVRVVDKGGPKRTMTVDVVEPLHDS